MEAHARCRLCLPLYAPSSLLSAQGDKMCSSSNQKPCALKTSVRTLNLGDVVVAEM